MQVPRAHGYPRCPVSSFPSIVDCRIPLATPSASTAAEPGASTSAAPSIATSRARRSRAAFCRRLVFIPDARPCRAAAHASRAARPALCAPLVLRRNSLVSLCVRHCRNWPQNCRTTASRPGNLRCGRLSLDGRSRHTALPVATRVSRASRICRLRRTYRWLQLLGDIGWHAGRRLRVLRALRWLTLGLHSPAVLRVFELNTSSLRRYSAPSAFFWCLLGSKRCIVPISRRLARSLAGVRRRIGGALDRPLRCIRQCVPGHATFVRFCLLAVMARILGVQFC